MCRCYVNVVAAGTPWSSSSSSRSTVKFDADTDVYSLADVIKRYYRELSQSIFTDQLANALIDVFTCKPLNLICSLWTFVILIDFTKLFRTSNSNHVRFCQECFSFDMPGDLWRKRVFSVILCILCFCIIFYIVGSFKCWVSGLFSSSYFERINDDDDDERLRVNLLTSM